MQNKDETELIARSINGDQEAFAQLVDRYKNALYHHCFAIVHHEDVAEEIAQDTFITAYYKLSKYRSEYRLSTWLFKIATNKALNYIKKNRHETMANNAVIEAIVSKNRQPEEQALDTELHAAVDKLQPRYRIVISLYYWQGLSYQDIAEILAVPIGSVKGWMNRAKSQLRKELS